MIRKEFSLSKNALNLGALTGLVMSVIQLLAFSFNAGDSSVVQWLLYILIITSVSWGSRKYRDLNEGFISYGQALMFGLLLAFGSALVFGFFNYLYISYLNPEYIQNVLSQMEMALYEAGYDDKMVKTMMDLYHSFFGPGMYAFALIFNFTFAGLLISLVISFFVKNNKSVF